MIVKLQDDLTWWWWRHDDVIMTDDESLWIFMNLYDKSATVNSYPSHVPYHIVNFRQYGEGHEVFFISVSFVCLRVCCRLDWYSRWWSYPNTCTSHSVRWMPDWPRSGKTVSQHPSRMPGQQFSVHIAWLQGVFRVTLLTCVPRCGGTSEVLVYSNLLFVCLMNRVICSCPYRSVGRYEQRIPSSLKAKVPFDNANITVTCGTLVAVHLNLLKMATVPTHLHGSNCRAKWVHWVVCTSFPLLLNWVLVSSVTFDCKFSHDASWY